MTSLPIAIAGAILLIAGWLLLRRSGPAFRVGRLLGSAPQATLAEVVAETGSSGPHYVRTHGRISSDEEFPDEQQRPLVFRRERLERGDDRGRWQVVSERRLAVPFAVEDREAQVEVDLDALGDGLVVLPREAVGLARELPAAWGAIRDTLPPEAPVRVRIEQVSAVEHATVVGVAQRTADGSVRLTAGMGRPLILSTVEPAAAMRILASGRRRTVLGATALLVVGLGLLATAVVVLVLGW